MTTNKTNWVVTRSDRRMKFEDIKKPPYDGGAFSIMNVTSPDPKEANELRTTISNIPTLDQAVDIYAAWCIALQDGCVQILDAVSETEHGFFML